MSVKGTRSWCVVVKCIKDNNYTRYHTPRYHCCREMHFISRLNVKFWQSLWSMKWRQGHRVKVPAWRVCHGQLPCKVSSSQLPLLQRNELYFKTQRKFSRLDTKYWQSQWSWNEGQGHRVKVPLLKECVKDNYYARFHLHCYHCCREMNFISRLNINF